MTILFHLNQRSQAASLYLLIDPSTASMLPWYDAQRMKKVEVEAEVE